MKIAVLGGGHGAYAAAADLAEQGHEVRHWRRNAAALSPVITLLDEKGSRAVNVSISSSIQETLKRAELISAGPRHCADGHRARHGAARDDGQVVFLPPGTFGSYAMAQVVKAKLRVGGDRHAAVARSQARPVGSGDHHSRSALADWRLSIQRTRQGHSGHPQGVPSVEPCGNALSGALMNAGPIIHPPLILMNAGPLEASNNYDIHSEGTQPAVRAVTDRLDQERIAVREALGFRAPHYPLKDHYTSDRWMYGDAHKKLVESGDWREPVPLREHRYMTEDVVFGLAFLASVARWARVPAPLAEGLLAIAGGILGKDLTQGERTLRALGLESLSREELFKRL